MRDYSWGKFGYAYWANSCFAFLSYAFAAVMSILGDEVTDFFLAVKVSQMEVR